MDLRTGKTYWNDRHRVAALPCIALDAGARCDVLIVGGGITGALVADRLAEEGVDVIVIDKRDFGAGSTAASSALVMYDIDVHLTDLAERYGWERAARCYQASLRGLNDFAAIAQSLPCDFQWRRSLYLASRRSHARALEAECHARWKAGIEVDLLGSAEISARWDLDAPAALLSHRAGQVDPLRFTHALLARAARHGARLAARTNVQHIESVDGGMQAALENGEAVRSNHVVVTTGYETADLLPDVPGKLRSTYVICSEPLQALPAWCDECIVWETSRPYLYMRSTSDGRLMVGGADVAFKSPAARDALLARRTRLLQRRFAITAPHCRFEPEYAWTGTFGESPDGLPYIGRPAHNGARHHASLSEGGALSSRGHGGCLFAMGYGGNGITWGTLAAELICDELHGRRNADAALFAFDRE